MIYSPKQYRRGYTHNSYLFLILFSALAAETPGKLNVKKREEKGKKKG